MFSFIKKSFARKKARRITREYPAVIDSFSLEDRRTIQFANWQNPLTNAITITSNMVDFFRQFIAEGDLVIDIGANIGDTTVPMALCAGKTGITLGFDPNPYVFKILKQNASLNPEYTNIHPFNYAITTTPEEFYFISSEASFANGGISQTKESIHGKYVAAEKVKGVNLKNFLQENYSNNLHKLSFIKIDTEGYDKEIIKSISDLITAYQPVIIAESFGKSSNDAKMELYDVIARHDYDIFYFADFDTTAEVKKMHTKQQMTDWKDTINIFATPKNKTTPVASQ